MHTGEGRTKSVPILSGILESCGDVYHPIIRKEEEQRGKQSISRSMEWYRFEKTGHDWSVVNRTKLVVPKAMIEAKVKKPARTMLQDLLSMPTLRRKQVDQLINEKNSTELASGVEWCAAIVDQRKRDIRQGNKLVRECLYMDVVVFLLSSIDQDSRGFTSTLENYLTTAEPIKPRRMAGHVESTISNNIGVEECEYSADPCAQRLWEGTLRQRRNHHSQTGNVQDTAGQTPVQFCEPSESHLGNGANEHVTHHVYPDRLEGVEHQSIHETGGATGHERRTNNECNKDEAGFKALKSGKPRTSSPSSTYPSASGKIGPTQSGFSEEAPGLSRSISMVELHTLPVQPVTRYAPNIDQTRKGSAFVNDTSFGQIVVPQPTVLARRRDEKPLSKSITKSVSGGPVKRGFAVVIEDALLCTSLSWQKIAPRNIAEACTAVRGKLNSSRISACIGLILFVLTCLALQYASTANSIAGKSLKLDLWRDCHDRADARLSRTCAQLATAGYGDFR